MRSRLFTVSRKAVQDPHCSVWSGQRERAMPYLRLSGAWLGRLGFAIGSKVRIAAEPGRLVLELAEPVDEVAEAPAGAPAEAPASPAASLRDFVSGNDDGARRSQRPENGSRGRGAGFRAPARRPGRR